MDIIDPPEFNTIEKITIKCNKCHETLKYNATYSQIDDLLGNHICSPINYDLPSNNDDIPF